MHLFANASYAADCPADVFRLSNQSMYRVVVRPHERTMLLYSTLRCGSVASKFRNADDPTKVMATTVNGRRKFREQRAVTALRYELNENWIAMVWSRICLQRTTFCVEFDSQIRPSNR